MKTGFVAAVDQSHAEDIPHDQGSALYQVAIVAAAVLLIVSAAFL